MKMMKRALGLLLALGLLMSAAGAAACDDRWTVVDSGSIDESGKYRLEESRGSALQIEGRDVTLCLHGKGSDIAVHPDANLTIVDCQGGGGGVKVNIFASGTVTMEAGSFGEVENRGTFTMNGGEIVERVTVEEGATFTMNGGELSGTSSNDALKVYGGRAVITGGLIGEGGAYIRDGYLEVGGKARIITQNSPAISPDGGRVVITGNAHLEGQSGVWYDETPRRYDLTVGGDAEVVGSEVGIFSFGSTKIDTTKSIKGGAAAVLHLGESESLSIARGMFEMTMEELPKPYGPAILIMPLLGEDDKGAPIPGDPVAADKRIIAPGSGVVAGGFAEKLLVVDRLPAAAAQDLPSTGDPSMLGAWVCLLGASAAGIKLRRKK